MNKEDFVSYEIAVKLKELGFDWPCSHYYTKENASDNDVWLTTAAFSPEDWNNGRNAEPVFLKPLCSAPSLWKAQKWLREKHGFYVEPHFNFDCHVVTIVDDEGGYEKELDDEFESYESALSDGIKAALKLIEEGEE